jgi:hypothetical protein
MRPSGHAIMIAYPMWHDGVTSSEPPLSAAPALPLRFRQYHSFVYVRLINPRIYYCRMYVHMCKHVNVSIKASFVAHVPTVILEICFIVYI